MAHVATAASGASRSGMRAARPERTHSSGLLPPCSSISSSPLSRATSGRSPMVPLMPSMTSRRKRPRFSWEPP